MKKVLTLAILLTGLTALTPVSIAQAQDQNITLENIVKLRKQISASAWKAINKQAQTKSNQLIEVNVVTGPKTKTLFKNPKSAIDKVVGTFNDYEAPDKVIIIQFNYLDMKWAQKTILNFFTKEELNRISNGNLNRLFETKCEASRKDCFGSEAIQVSEEQGLIIQGVPKSLPASYVEIQRFSTGQLETHEFFHLMQEKPLFGKDLGVKPRPPVWLIEGSAEWMQNAIVNSNKYSNYLKFIKADSQSLYPAANSKKFWVDLLSVTDNREFNEKYDQWLAYNGGSRVTEILVAIYGPTVVLDLYNEFSNGQGFEAAFENVTGTKFKEAIPILAEALSLNIKDLTTGY